MSRYQHRISKLEERIVPKEIYPGIIFVSFGHPDDETVSASLAVIVNGNGEQLWRHDAESEDDFRLRTYATKAAGCSLDELSEEQVAAVYAMGRKLQFTDEAKDSGYES